MPDISMCRGGECPNRMTCYRFTAEPNPHWQSYISFPGMDGVTECDRYIEARSESQIKRIKIQTEKLEGRDV